MLIQIPLTHLGCTSFYPTGDADLSKYSNHEGSILLKLKDKSELEVPQKCSLFIEKGKIDQAKLSEYNSTLYWTKDYRRLRSEVDEIVSTLPNSADSFWLVMDDKENEIKKICAGDIEEIQIQKINWVTTSILVVSMTGLLIFLLLWNPHIKIFKGFPTPSWHL